MGKSSPLMMRVALGKTLGLALGVLGFFLIPIYSSETVSVGYLIGIILWGVLLGGLIGMSGLFKKHPLFGFRIHWLWRGGMMGVFMYLLLVLLSYDTIEALMSTKWPDVSPYWILVEGFIVGAVLDAICTKISGEGMKLVK